MVDHRNVVMDNTSVVLFSVYPFFEDGLIVKVKGQSGGVKDARALEATSFGLQHVIGAVAILVDPPSDRIALIARINLLRPVTAVGEDATRLCTNQNIGS